jgi:hypothetical protein
VRLRFFAPALVAVLSLVAARAHAAQSFIYVAPSCQDTAGCATSVLIYDANTGGLAASIPLPADMNPFGLKLSQDGQRLYVALSRGGGTSVTVIDTTRHVVVGTHDAGNAIGGMAVSRDGSRLFFASGTTLFIYDTAANAIVATAAAGSILQSIAANPSSDRIYTVEGIGAEAVRQYDSLSGAAIPGGANTSDLSWSHIHPVRDDRHAGAGATVSGTIVNFGWALTPPPAMIPVDGSTIDVLIDGAVASHPTYGFARGDVDALFPGYANTGYAVGFFILDTTTLANGVHSIAWVVRDNRGGVQGIGSRFFTVDNP